jgi:hypothetical protein
MIARWIHRTAWRGDLVGRIGFRRYCPYPVGNINKTARECCEAGDCGCDNARRYIKQNREEK